MEDSSTTVRATSVFRAVLLLCCATLALSATTHFPSFDVPVAGVTDTEATAITPSGTIVGRYFTPDGHTHGFRLVDGEFQFIDIPGAISQTDITWVNARGDIVGSYNSNGMTHAYVLRHGHVTTIDYPGALLTLGFGISNSGDVVGPEFTNDFFSPRLPL